ncbi:gamma-glutamylcyclotransferase [Amycolatopsis silviterrae]|uniref:Gamma-glutamylcyclotransferase n=1 Tax=Amycolatopsis silviterrae TaxID=1656914 RepID=A0ABW5GYS4_9PSEU
MHHDGAGHALATAPPGWRTRTPVLAYGSNACPSKITWLRTQLGLTGPVVAARVRCTGLAAVWAAGMRERDGQRPATLTALPGWTEDHFVWFATPEQLAVLDVCEGRGNRYDLAVLDNADIRLDGELLSGVHAYVGAAPVRFPLLVNGSPVLVADVAQAEAALLAGEPAAGHGLACTVLPPEHTFS